MRDLTVDPRWCTIDPITMAVGAAGALAGSLFGGGGGGGAPAAAAPAAPTPQAAPAKTPAPKQNTSQASSFIGGVPTPPPSTGQKTLLGQ